LQLLVGFANENISTDMLEFLLVCPYL